MTLRHFLPNMFAALALVTPAAAADQPRAVIEMFTSQGCNSCPPADRLVGELVNDPSIIVLSYSVTYWDYLGWRDTLALPENTQRQRAYALGRGDRQVYTPQAVVDGVFHAVGSDRRDIEAKAARARTGRDDGAPLSVPVSVSKDGSAMTVSIGTGTEKAPGDCRVSVVEFDKEQTVAIGRGENRGETITYHNVVRASREIGRWSGGTLKLPVDAKTDDPKKGIVILVQQMSSGSNPGVIIGATQIR